MKPLFEKGIINRILVNKFVNKLKNMIKKGTIILIMIAPKTPVKIRVKNGLSKEVSFRVEII